MTSQAVADCSTATVQADIRARHAYPVPSVPGSIKLDAMECPYPYKGAHAVRNKLGHAWREYGAQSLAAGRHDGSRR